jgi:hypothetical protein
MPRQRREVSDIKHVYEIRPRKDHRGVDLISDVLSFSRPIHDQGRSCPVNVTGPACFTTG